MDILGKPRRIGALCLPIYPIPMTSLRFCQWKQAHIVAGWRGYDGSDVTHLEQHWHLESWVTVTDLRGCCRA